MHPRIIVLATIATSAFAQEARSAEPEPWAPSVATSVWTGPQASSAPGASYTNPFTSYLTQTNSMGVVTGMPSVWTSQPAAATWQPKVITTQPLPVMQNTTTYNHPTHSASTLWSTASQSTSSSMTPTPTFAQSTGGAASNKVAGAGAALVVMAVGFSLL